MTIPEIIEQAKSMTSAERDELIHQLSMMQQNTNDDGQGSSSHWGQSLVNLVNEIEPIEMLYPEIEDPVEWVKHRRAMARQDKHLNHKDTETQRNN
ncbi:MAG: hypothetical protein AAFV93_06800 [Chloroflexota bacterium]